MEGWRSRESGEVPRWKVLVVPDENDGSGRLTSRRVPFFRTIVCLGRALVTTGAPTGGVRDQKQDADDLTGLEFIASAGDGGSR